MRSIRFVGVFRRVVLLSRWFVGVSGFVLLCFFSRYVGTGYFWAGVEKLRGVFEVNRVVILILLVSFFNKCWLFVSLL